MQLHKVLQRVRRSIRFTVHRGNAGIAALAECAPIGAMEFDKIVAFAKEKEVDLVIVGMDDPLVGGPCR